MRRTVLHSIAAASVLLGVVEAARRPHYGGELRIEVRASARTAEPGAAEFLNDVFETLIKLDERGEPQPWLASSWSHEPERKRWVFTARQNVMLHNGVIWSPPGGVIAVPDDRPIGQILHDLARPRNAIVVKASDGSAAGTGPFRIARWEEGTSATLAAHDGYWGGRPYLDAIEIQMGRGLAEQTIDFQLGKADVVERQVTDLRALKQGGIRAFATPPIEILALRFEARVPVKVREAVAFSIDRTAILNVILQKQGESSGALLPRWLSGYSFLFAAERNIARARELGSGGAPLMFAYDAQSSVIRPIAQRLAVNASEAGITMRPSSGAPDVRLMRIPIQSRDPRTALEDLAALLQLPWPSSAQSPYEVERALIDAFLVVPIVHLPQVWALSSRVKNWPDLPNVWLDPRETQ